VLRSVRPEWIFHLAAYGAYPFQTELSRIAETNVAGAANLVDAALRVGFEALVNAGSSSEYGHQSSAPAEDRPPEPNSAYAWSKASATQLWQLTGRARGVHMPTLRLYSVFGPWEEPTRFLPTLIAHGLRGALPPLADPTVARDFVYVDDVADALVGAAGRPGADPGVVYNVGTGVQSTLADVVALARTLLEVDEEPRWGSMPNRSWDTTVWVADPRKIQAELGWRPRHSLASGFRSFVDWYRTHLEVATL
jgi:dolichol-phosphate mannosyltransferase